MSKSLRTAMAAVVLIVPVVLELAWNAFGDHALGLEIFAVAQLAGWVLILSVCRQTAVPSRRTARLGRNCVLVGCSLHVLFAIGYAVTAVDTEPAAAVWAPFLLGFLTLFLGGVTWGLHLVRTAGAPLAGWGLVAAGTTGLVAMVFGGDPWHDVFLLASYAAWGFVGLGFDSERHRSGSATPVAVTR
jgi:hypothetical protein